MASFGERRPLDEAIVRGGIYLERVRYRARLEPYLEADDKGRMLVLAQRDLLERRGETLARVFGFLGVDPEFESPLFGRLRHVTAEKGRRSRALDRIRSHPLAAPGFRLPQEMKWRIERLAAGRRAEAPALGEAARELIAAEVGADVDWVAERFGIDTTGWLGR
jgi:hypothetical protein